MIGEGGGGVFGVNAGWYNSCTVLAYHNPVQDVPSNMGWLSNELCKNMYFTSRHEGSSNWKLKSPSTIKLCDALVH